MLIVSGRVIDGTGSPWYWADVGIQDSRIVAIGALAGRNAQRTINADGCFVSPGFIDMHTHSDLQLLKNPLHECKIRQGVTTDVIGHDGLGLAPITPHTGQLLQTQLAGWNGQPGADWDWNTITTYLDHFDGRVAVNVATHVPHGTIRLIVMGEAARAPTANELRQMQVLVDSAMREGAIGLSTGLQYAPAMFATDDEVVELCKALKPYNGMYSPHHRNYGMHALEAYADSIEIGRRAGIPVHLTHCHFGFAVNKNRASELLALIDNARVSGIEVTMDSYPYLAGNTYLHALLPSWVHAGGSETLLQRLQSLDLRLRIQHEMEVTGSDGFHNVPLGWEMIQIAAIPEGVYDRPLAGLSMIEAAAITGQSPFDFYCDLLIQTRLGVSCLAHIGNEENVQAILKHPAQMVGSDGILVGERPHPRGWGSHARFLAHYTRDLGLLTWEEAIRKMTSAAARRIGCLDRGILRPGFAADVVIFDPAKIRDTATYENPRQHPEGIYYVLVNGALVIDNEQVTGRTPGRALRKIYGRKPERITELPIKM
ncbi:MAG: N-acyl-D-amino-acid deacylase family protein [Aggregatilineales bacterium]